MAGTCECSNEPLGSIKCGEFNWRKQVEYIQSQFSVLCHVCGHVIRDNRYFKNSLFCLVPVSYVLWSYHLGKFGRQQNIIHHP